LEGGIKEKGEKRRRDG